MKLCFLFSSIFFSSCIGYGSSSLKCCIYVCCILSTRFKVVNRCGRSRPGYRLTPLLRTKFSDSTFRYLVRPTVEGKGNESQYLKVNSVFQNIFLGIKKKYIQEVSTHHINFISQHYKRKIFQLRIILVITKLT